jgi:succinoglycan biosynthesis transport protein ExoP
MNDGPYPSAQAAMAGNLVSSQPQGLPPDPQVNITPHLGTTGPLGAPEAREDGVNWGRYIAALRRYRWLMLGVVLLGSALGVVATRFMPPKYLATTTIWVENRNPGAGPIRPGELLDNMGWTQLLQTPFIYEPVVLKLRLYIKPKVKADSTVFSGFEVDTKGFRPGTFTLEVDPSGKQWRLSARDSVIDRGQVGDSIGRGLNWLWAPTTAELGTPRKIEFTLSDPRVIVAQISGGLSAALPEGGTFMRVNYSSTERNMVAPIVNAVSAEFVATAADLKKRKLTELRVALDSQVAIAYQNLRNAEAALKSFQISTITKPRNGVLPVTPGLTATTSTATGAYFQQKVTLDGIRQDREQLEQVFARSQSGPITVDAFQTIPSAAQAPQLQQALRDLTAREAELTALLARYTPEHPLVKQTQADMDRIRTELLPRYAQALIDQLKLQERDLEQRLAGAAEELREVPTVTITESRLMRDLDAADALYKMLSGRLEEAKLQELSAIPDVRVLDWAVTPRKPSSSTAPKIIFMAVMASIGAAVALALLLDQLDRRFRYPEQVSSELGLPILGAIPAIRKTRRGELAPEQAAQVIEAFRTVRLNLAHSYGSAGPVMLTISSPGAGDGKSLVSSNLAVSFAEAGYRTVLVDGDIRRGEIHRMFGVDRRPGLLDHLTGGAPFEEILRPTSQRNLTVVPCGTRRHHGPELLGSAAMAEAMALFKARFDVIIVDSPPLGAGIDPFVLGTTTGHLMLVFRTGETDRQMAEAKLRLLDRLPVRVLGAVLNEIEAEGNYRYYSYLYGYTSDEEPAQIGAESSGGKNGHGA